MEYNQALLKEIITELKIEPITAKCLLSAGLSSLKECKDFLNPSLSRLTKLEEYDGLKDVSDRIKQAIDNKESVMIYGDYDTDGVTSVAMLKLFLASKGVDVNYFIPDRRKDGYGLSEQAIEALAEEYNPDLFITVDCGITNIEEVDYILEAIGSDIVITDHHEPQDTLPNCKIFNPHVNSHENAYEYLCGAGVVLRLIESLSSFEESLEYYDLAALATVADMMPLKGDNREIVSYGLSILNAKPRKGIELLLKSFTKDKIAASDISFKIAPRINAVGRLANANEVVDLFIEQDYFLLENLVETITEYHNERQTLTTKLYEDVVDELQNYDFDKYPIIILKKKGWDEGVLGIAAARVAGEFNRPTILLTEQPSGDLKGSGRSIEAVNIFECVKHSSLNPSKYGGHSQAFGVSMESGEFDQFKESVNKYFKSAYENEVLLQDGREYFDFKTEVQNPMKVARELEKLEPFGQGNPRPFFEAVIGNIGFSQIGDKPHIAYKTRGFQIAGFHMLDKLDIINSEIEKKIVFTLGINTYKGIDSVQAILDSVKCISHSDAVITNYALTSLYPDKSIFKPENITLDNALKLIEGNNYTTAYICYTKQSFDEFINACKSPIIKNSYFIENPCPNNAIYFNIDEGADLSRYKNVVFIDRPISLGYIDILKLNKDCKVYYIDNNNGIDLLKSLKIDYSILGSIYRQIEKKAEGSSIINVSKLYVDIETLLNINYNIFIVAICIFMDLEILVKEGKFLRLQKNVKNPIANSRLYNLIMEG